MVFRPRTLITLLEGSPPQTHQKSQRVTAISSGAALPDGAMKMQKEGPETTVPRPDLKHRHLKLVVRGLSAWYERS